MPSPQLEIRLILMIFFKWKRSRYDRDNLFSTFWEKKPSLKALFLHFLLHFRIGRLLSLLLFLKLIKSENVRLFFSEIHISHGCFFSNFHTKTPFSHALTWSKYDQKPILYFFVRCIPHFFAKNSKNVGFFVLYGNGPMEAFLPFFHK